MKGIIHGLLCLLLLAASAPVQGQSGSGSGYDYSINAGDPSTITITGYTGPSGTVTIPAIINALMVTSIGDGAFSPFLGNTCPTSLRIPNNINSIGDYVFEDCSSLTNIMIGSGVTNIGAYAFSGFFSLTSITVNAQNPSFSSSGGVLFDKSQITLIEHPSSLGGSYAIPDTVTTIGDYAFDGCILTNVSIPNSVTTIGTAAFYNCLSLANVTLPNSVTSIEDSAFSYCQRLSNFVIPSTITNLGGDVFEACIGLTSITIPNGIPSIGGFMFDNCVGLTNVTIPNSVTSIGFAAFYQDDHLTNFTIPSSVTNIGDAAFHYCTGLTGVYFIGSAPSADATVFEYSNPTVYYLPGTTGWSVFATNTGVPVMLWNPVILVSGTNFGVQNNQFGFNIAGTNNFTVVVEACTNLADPVWTPLQTTTLTNGLFYFSDLQWMNYRSRFYQLTMP